MKRILCFVLIALMCLVSCSKEPKKDVAVMVSDQQLSQFTTDMTPCHDKKYYIIMGANIKDDTLVSVINIYSDIGDMVYSFEAGNVDNFRGVCWEKDSYNIWTLTGDNTLRCYKFSDNKWQLEKDALIPEYMLKK